MQNEVDALTARGITPDSLGDTRTGILILPADVAADGRLHTFDSEIGLDADDIRTFLATIGRSSKRDEMGFTRSDLLGQFGIGLLSAFVVTDEIEVLTRKGDGPLVRWQGRSDGSYALEENRRCLRRAGRRAMNACSGSPRARAPA